MLTKRIIPCLDVNDGRVVKGVNFVNLIDAGDPVAIAEAYYKAVADELVFLDITASSDARNTVADMVRKVAEKVFIPFTVELFITSLLLIFVTVYFDKYTLKTLQSFVFVVFVIISDIS